MMLSRIRYNLKKPGNGRASFAIVKDVVKADGTRSAATMKDERIDALNKLLEDGLKNATVVELELRAMIAEWQKADEKRKGAAVFNEDNRRILELLWDRKYKHRQTIDPRSSRDRLTRAIEALGPLSLVSADRDVLQKIVNKQFKGNKQRDIVSALNQLLRAAGRDIELMRAKKERRTVRHLSPTDFERVFKQVEDRRFALLFAVCFATGCRTGEAFGLRPESLKADGVLYIEGQMDMDENFRDTKNRRERHAVINPVWEKEVTEWLALSSEEKGAFRTEKHAHVLKPLCQKLFPLERTKWCDMRDLRHSYAVWLLSKGVSLALTAQSLGNSVQVCQEYYAGFVLNPDSITAIKAILQKEEIR